MVSFAANFWRSVIIAESQDDKNFREIFFGKRIHYGKIFKSLFRKFSSRQRSTFCVQISWNLADGKSLKSWVAYLAEKKTKIRLAPTLSILRESRLKSAQTSPQQCTPSAPYFIQISSLSTKRVNIVFAPWSKSNIRPKHSFEVNN